MGGHLHTVLDQAVLPNLELGRRQSPPKSAGEERLVKVHKDAADDVDAVRDAVRQDDRLNARPEIRDALKKLDDAKGRLEQAVKPDGGLDNRMGP
jgi:hypothetical protein